MLIVSLPDPRTKSRVKVQGRNCLELQLEKRRAPTQKKHLGVCTATTWEDYKRARQRAPLGQSLKPVTLRKGCAFGGHHWPVDAIHNNSDFLFRAFDFFFIHVEQSAI